MAATTIRAVQILGDKATPVVSSIARVPRPIPQDDQILIRVYAAGIIGDELGWPELWDSPQHVPGHEISGIIAGLGPSYTGDLEVDQEVFGFLGIHGKGQGQAEYAIALPGDVVPKPRSIQHDQAAVLPIPILTAQQALFTHGGLAEGMSVLITGASGAVGLLAVQLAARVRDIEITALASAKHHEALKLFGVSKCLDYHERNWYEQVSDVDIVFDTAGSLVLHKSWDVVRSNGIIVTVADPIPAWAFGSGVPEELSSHSKVRHVFFILSPNPKGLREAAEMLDCGQLQALGIRPFAIDQAVEAWSYARLRGRNAKAVLVFNHRDRRRDR